MQLRDIEHDPFTGITKKWYFDGDKIVCRKEFDERDFLDLTAIERSATAGESFINSKHAFHRMACIPPIVYEKILREHNIDILGDLSPLEQKKVYRIIELEYPWCKTHEKKLWRAVKNPRGAAADGTS